MAEIIYSTRQTPPDTKRYYIFRLVEHNVCTIKLHGVHSTQINLFLVAEKDIELNK